jgi:hypothetical protein
VAVGEFFVPRYVQATMIDRDTQADARAVQIAVLRRLGPSKRLELAMSMSDDARQMSIDGIQRRHPEYTEREAQLALFKHLWGTELFMHVWGPETSPR